MYTVKSTFFIGNLFFASWTLVSWMGRYLIDLDKTWNICILYFHFLHMFFLSVMISNLMQVFDLSHSCLLKSARDPLISSRATSGSYIA